MMRKSKDSKTVVSHLKQMTGQAMIEYALILVLLGVAFGVALAATGPAIGNVFSNTVFQLLRQTPEGEGLEVLGPVEFWRTVTAVAMTPDSEREFELPTRTPAPPTSTPTLGPSPTPTPTIPTNTPIPSNTPLPTSTPLDITKVAPFLDTVDDEEWWRVNASVFVGSDDWCGEYYPNYTWDGDPILRCNREDGRQFHGKLDYDWGPNGPFTNWPAANPYNRFSVRWTKPIWVDPLAWPTGTTEIGIVVNVSHDDGLRVRLGNTVVYENLNGSGTTSIPINVPVGGTPSDLIVEYREDTNNAAVSVSIGISSNQADTAVDGGGAATSGTADCNWGRKQQANDTYSQDFMWEEYIGGDLPQNSRCYLEFRGSVYIPNTDGFPAPETKAMTMPQMVFWDVWDMDSNRHTGWLEVAEYIDDPVDSGQVDYDAMTWQRIDLRQGNTVNFNWTRNTIDLTNVNGTDFRGKRMAFRFVMENTGAGGTRKWYIDDIEFRDAYDVTLGGSELREFSVGEYWDLNRAEQANDFIGSRSWAITCTSMSVVSPSGSCSFEDSPGDAEYRDFSESTSWSTSLEQSRVHFLEMKGWVNIPSSGLGDPDYEGDTGDGLLTFYHGFNLGRNTGLQVQYTTDDYGIGPTNWQPVPGIDPDEPYGEIIPHTDWNDVSRMVMEKEEIPLGEIGETRFRLRFAMLVRSNANLRDGWWIDDIRIEREGNPRFLDYPFFDGAEEGIANWQTVGSWGRTNIVARNDEHAFTDTPGEGNRYRSNTNTSLAFRWALDLHNDTPENLILYDRNDAGGNSNLENPGTLALPALDPVLTFYHRRDLNYYDNFIVEYRFATDDGDDWTHLWSYVFRMGTNRSRGSDWNARSGTQLGWERVEIDLAPAVRTIATSPGIGTGNDLRDDDIYIRFRLQADGSNTDDGVWIDDIRIEDRAEKVYYLWDEFTTPTVGGEILNAGSGRYYFDDIDNGDWWTKWYVGGGWDAIDWEQNSGLFAMHESPDEQIAPIGNPIITSIPDGSTFDYIIEWPELATDGNTSYLGDNDLIETPDNTFQVMEMQTIIDLRGTLADTNPTLYFWNRHYPGRDDRISVEISVELTGNQNNIDNYMNDKCRSSNRLQCYEHQYGWGEWEEVWYRTAFVKAWGWEREAIDLTSWAAPDVDTQGRRIRIRFVYDALDNGDNRDGWYIDDVEVGPRRDRVIHVLQTGGWFDGARDMSNWVGEGTWGLSPQLHRGDAGGAVSLGFWEETWMNCNNCKNLAPSGTNNSLKYAVGADIFLDNDFVVLADSVQPGRPSSTYTGEGSPVTRTVVDINYGRGPIPGTFDEKYSYVGRWTLDTPIIGTGGIEGGEYSFVTYSDDGVRLKYEELNPDGTTSPVGPDPAGNDILEWNIIYYWSSHSTRPDLGVATFETGKRYRLTLEYYQDGGGASISLSSGGAAYSFTDSPKQGAGPAFPDVPALLLADTSLILNGTIDLENTDTPVMQYYTYYEVMDDVRVEISTDGGITWTGNGLGGKLFDSSGNEFDRFDGNRWDGERLPGPEEDNWRLRRHKLTNFIGREIMIRFRLERTNFNEGKRINRDGNCLNSPNNCNSNGYFVSVWITDIEIADAGPIP